jgi:hypothetical protein
MVVDAVLCLDQDDLDENLIGVKKIPGGGLQVRDCLQSFLTFTNCVIS